MTWNKGPKVRIVYHRADAVEEEVNRLDPGGNLQVPGKEYMDTRTIPKTC